MDLIRHPRSLPEHQLDEEHAADGILDLEQTQVADQGQGGVGSDGERHIANLSFKV